MHDLTQIGAAWAEATSADLSGLVGKEIAISGPRISDGAPGRLLGSKGSVVHTACTSEGEERAELAFIAPLSAALALAAVQLGKEPDELKGAKLEGEVRDAHKGVMDLCVGILGRVLDEEASLPGVTLGAIDTIELPISEGVLPAPGGYRLARYDLVIEGGSKETIDLLIPAEQAASWFGPSSIAPQDEPEGANVALIDNTLVERDEIDELSEGLGREIVLIEVADIGSEVADELAECCALILGWELDGRAGLDVLEALRRDPLTAQLRIALASEAPTPAMVSAAMRWGAFTFLCKPYDADEIRERLLSPPAEE